MATLHVSSVDCQAEREASAIGWFAENLGQPQPLPPLRRESELRELAAALGWKAPPRQRYPHELVTKRWIRVLQCIANGQPLPAFKSEITTPADRERRAARRRERAALVKRLATMPRSQTVNLHSAAKMTGIGIRTLERARANGRLAVVKDGQRVTVPIPALRAYLATKV